MDFLRLEYHVKLNKMAHEICILFGLFLMMKKKNLAMFLNLWFCIMIELNQIFEFFEIGFPEEPVEAVEVVVEEDLHAPMSIQATCAFSSVEIVCSRALLQKAGADGEKAYLFRFFKDDEKTPVFSKIGTSTRDCYKRLKEEIRYYIAKSGLDITRVEIVEIWNCGNTPAESYESFMRALLIKKYPNTWHKNDRFFGVSISLETFVKLCRQYEEL